MTESSAGFELKRWVQDVLNREMGFSTATGSPEPVHVLNGLLDSVLEGERGVAVATKIVAKKFSLDEVVAAAKDCEISLPSEKSSLLRVRTGVRGLLASDHAVFPSSQSFQVAHPAFVTRDRAESRLGNLAAALILEDPNGREALEALVARFSQPQPNPIWVLEAALADRVDEDGYSVGGDVTRPPWFDDAACSEIVANLGGLLRRTVRLAAASPDPLDGLRLLAITASWAACLAFIHVSSVKSGSKSKPLILLTVAPPQAVPTVLAASYLGSFRGAVTSFSDWTTDLMRAHIREQFGLSHDDSGVGASNDLRTWVESAQPFSSGKAIDKVVANVGNLFDDYASSGDVDGPVDAAARSLVDLLDASMNTPPSNWLASIGRTCGFVAPRRGATNRRFCVEAALVPSLVIAGMNDDEDFISMEDWGQRLRERFGLLYGPTASTQRLEPTPIETELSANRDALVQLLVETGLGSAYSDKVTEVLNPLAEVLANDA